MSPTPAESALGVAWLSFVYETEVYIQYRNACQTNSGRCRRYRFRRRCACDADAGGRTSGEREAGHTVLLTGETALRARRARGAALFENTNLLPAALNRYTC